MKNLLLALIAVLFPPLAVILKGELGVHLLLSILLTLLAYIPGLVHALYIVFREEL